MNKNDSLDNPHYSDLVRIFNDATNPGAVRGAALTAMRRTGDPNLKRLLSTVIPNYNNYPDIIVRHAEIQASKRGFGKEYIDKMEEIARTTNDPDVYGSTIYALGIVGGQQAVHSIISVNVRFNNPYIVKGALVKNYQSILNMLEIGQPEEMISSGIAAARMIALEPAVEALNDLKNSNITPELVVSVKSAIEYINANAIPYNYEKWEVD